MKQRDSEAEEGREGGDDRISLEPGQLVEKQDPCGNEDGERAKGDEASVEEHEMAELKKTRGDTSLFQLADLSLRMLA